MKKASARLVVPHDPSTVFNVVSAIGEMDRWIKGLTEPREESADEMGKGKEFSAWYSGGGVRYEYRFRVHSWIPDRVFGFHSTRGPLPFRNWLVIEPVPGGSAITSNVVPVPNGPAADFIFRRFGALIRFVIRRQQSGQLKSLKNYLACRK